MGQPKGSQPRLVSFVCWWCRVEREAKLLHHEVTGTEGTIRRCCRPCYETEDSNYRRVYPNQTQEKRELRDLKYQPWDRMPGQPEVKEGTALPKPPERQAFLEEDE